MGQGVNTKAAQVVASTLGIPIDKVMIKANNCHIGPNTRTTGASISTNLTTWTVFKACEDLKAKMEPIKKKLPSNTSWEKLVEDCWKNSIDLTGNYKPFPGENLENYSVWGV